MLKRSLVVTLLLLLMACGVEQLQSGRPSGAMVVDGGWTDWEEIEIHQVKEMNGLVVAVANDDRHLYLMARSPDQQLVRHLRMFGLKLKASGRGKGGATIRLRYHGSVALADSLPPPGGGPGSDRMPLLRETGEEAGIPIPGMIEIERGDAVTRVAENRPDGLAAGSAAVGDVYCFEFRLPLDDLFSELASDDTLQGRRVGLELAAEKMPGRMRYQMEKMAGNGGRRGGRGGGKGGASGPGGPPPAPRTLWATIRLTPAA